MKEWFMGIMALSGAGFGALIGGWNGAIVPLVIFMAIDYATGTIAAGVFHASKKTDGGGLESRAGFKGIMKKSAMLMVVIVGYQLDLLMCTTFVKEGIIMAFIANELISITENLGLMGVPLPPALNRAIEMFKDKEEKK